jgi:hypothetical protein
MADEKAAVQSVTPSATAPNWVRSKSRAGKVGGLIRAKICGTCAQPELSDAAVSVEGREQTQPVNATSNNAEANRLGPLDRIGNECFRGPDRMEMVMAGQITKAHHGNQKSFMQFRLIKLHARRTTTLYS